METKLNDLPDQTIEVDNIFDLESLIKNLNNSIYQQPHTDNSILYALLCLGNEIRKIKNHLNLE